MATNVSLPHDMYASLRQAWYDTWPQHRSTMTVFASTMVLAGLQHLIATECPPGTIPGSVSTRRHELAQSGWSVGLRPHVFEKCEGLAQCYRPTLDARGAPRVVSAPMVARWAIRISLQALAGATPEK